MQPITLERVLLELGRYFRSLDIRCAALLTEPKSPSAVLVGIRISSRSVQEVRAGYAALSTRFGTRRADTFRIFLEARPFSALETLIAELAKQTITFKGTSVSLTTSVDVGAFQRGFIGRFPSDLEPPVNEEPWPSAFFSAGGSGQAHPAYFDPDLPIDLGRKTTFRTVGGFVDAFLGVRRAANYNRALFINIEMPARISSAKVEGSLVQLTVEARARLGGLKLSLEMRKAAGSDSLPAETRELRLARSVVDGKRFDLVAATEVPTEMGIRHFIAVLRHGSGLELDELNFRVPESEAEDQALPQPVVLIEQLEALRARAENVVPEDAGRPGLPGSGVTAFIGPFNALLFRVRLLLESDSVALEEIEHIEPLPEMQERLAVSYHKKARERILLGTQHLRAAVEARLSRGVGSEKELEQKFKILWSATQAARDFRAMEAECRQRGLSIAIVFVDIDHFKALNTKHTETIVDRTILPSLMCFIRDYVTFLGGAYRQGGDEFLLVLPNYDPVHAMWFVERLRSLIEGREFGNEGIMERMTISAGVACWPEAGDSYENVLHAANIAKKRAKETRNTVVAYGGEIAVQ